MAFLEVFPIEDMPVLIIPGILLALVYVYTGLWKLPSKGEKVSNADQYDPPKMEGHSTQLNKKSPVRELSNRAIKSFTYTNAQQQSGYSPGCCFLLLGSIQFGLLLFLELF